MTDWHADTETLSKYVHGTLEEIPTYSVEAHLLACERCRSVVGEATRGLRTQAERMERIWAGVMDATLAPTPGPIERGLRRIGVREHVARLLAATPSLRLSWFAAQAAALLFAVAAADASAGGPKSWQPVLVFLLVAPLIPMAGVAAAFGPGLDPTYEIGLAAPMQSHRLLLLRAAAVLVTSTVVTGLAALALPGLEWTAAAWILPSLGLTAVTLALATFIRPLWAAGGVTAVWVAVVLSARLPHDDVFAAFRGPGQVVFLAVALAGAAVVARRHDAYETRS